MTCLLLPTITCLNQMNKYVSQIYFSRASIVPADQCDGDEWNVREDHLLLDAVEMYGYGNWKDIARHVESKNETQVPKFSHLTNNIIV